MEEEDEEGEEPSLSHRETYAEISRDGDFIGYIEFVELRISWVDNEWLFEAMDGYSAVYGDLARALCARWDDVFMEATAYGDIVLLDRVWIKPAYRHSDIWVKIANHMLRTMYKSRALLILKPFPLEYEGKVEDDNKVAFLRRKRAMHRYYARVLGAVPFGDGPGTSEWMWVAHSDMIE